MGRNLPCANSQQRQHGQRGRHLGSGLSSPSQAQESPQIRTTELSCTGIPDPQNLCDLNVGPSPPESVLLCHKE